MTLRESIRETLRYSDHFAYPLTLEELHTRLIQFPISQISLSSRIQQMIKKGLIAKTGDFYHLPGRSSLVRHRLERARQSKPLLSRARALGQSLSKIPGVLAIFLTGSLAMKNGERGDDIDFMVVTHSGRLWTTRLLLTLYTSLRGVRRTPKDTQSAGQLCLNLYLSPKSFSLPPNKRSLYTAYELVQAVPLYDPRDARGTLLSANSWISDYLPNSPMQTASKRVVPSSKMSLPAAGRGATLALMRFIEPLAYRLQLLYMRHRMTKEYVTLDAAFFHPHDPGQAVLRKLSDFPRVVPSSKMRVQPLHFPTSQKS